MPKPRRAENEGLPNRWRIRSGAYYFQVPASDRELWGGRYEVRLGSSMEEASATFAELNLKVQQGISAFTPQPPSTKNLIKHWERQTTYDPSCGISLQMLQAIYGTALRGARVRNIEFSITRFDLVKLARLAKGRCMLTNHPWDVTTVHINGKRPWAPSLDRIDCAKGYEDGNCRLICVAANIALSDFGDEIFRTMAAGVRLKSPRAK